MKGPRSQSADLIRVIRGPRYDVLMNRKVKKEYDRLRSRHLKDFGRVQKSMMNFAQFGPENLPGEQFRWEGHFRSGVRGAARVRVGVIKGWQARILWRERPCGRAPCLHSRGVRSKEAGPCGSGSIAFGRP